MQYIVEKKLSAACSECNIVPIEDFFTGFLCPLFYSVDFLIRRKIIFLVIIAE